MTGQTSNIAKGLATNFTDVWLFTCVSPLVLPQTTFLNVASTTRLTHKRLFLHVYAHVYFQGVTECKNLTTIITDKWLFSSVNDHVVLKVLFLLESRAAHFALKGSFTGVLCELVLPHGFPVRKLQVTDTT